MTGVDHPGSRGNRLAATGRASVTRGGGSGALSPRSA